MSNLSLIEILVIGAAAYFGFAKNSVIDQKWGVLIVAAAILLIFFFGGATDSPLSGFGITAGGVNFTFVLIVGAILYFIYKRAQTGSSTTPLWLVLAGVMLLSALQGGLNF